MSTIEKPEGMSDEEFEAAQDLAQLLQQIAIVAYLTGRGPGGATEDEVRAAVDHTVETVAKVRGLDLGDGAGWLN